MKHTGADQPNPRWQLALVLAAVCAVATAAANLAVVVLGFGDAGRLGRELRALQQRVAVIEAEQRRPGPAQPPQSAPTPPAAKTKE